MQYFIHRINPLSQYIQLDLHIYCHKKETIMLQLPAWRPGRYELANYAQKIRKLEVFKTDVSIAVRKETKDLWTFSADEEGIYTVKYDFHANQMDAGGSWSDDEQLYLNFINFIFEVKGRADEEITVQIDLPPNYTTATALPQIDQHLFRAENFQHLVDSPLIASSSLSHFTYTVEKTTFHIWIQGDIHFDVADLLTTFKEFTCKQIKAFGEFPAEDYHFILQILPYKHYHGVEHQYSTVITLGPAIKLKDKEYLDKLVGVSSHELYHFWNVCRIRPKELMPYNFAKEAYINTGMVAEGVTTYMGDLFLLKSGYYTLEDYLKIIEKLLDREYESYGWQNQSIVSSSLDLWLDGYKTGIPDKKVSIYNRGAMISLCLDLILLDNGSSLHEVMKGMWIRFGKTNIGYSLKDFKDTVLATICDEGLNEFFERYIWGTEDIWPILVDQLRSIGITCDRAPRTSFLEGRLGIMTSDTGVVTKVHIAAPAFEQVMIGDEICHIGGEKFSPDYRSDAAAITMELLRFGREIKIILPHKDTSYYTQHKLRVLETAIKRKYWMS
ncbi:M61 family metallopeptidase [Anditalea andensis]|uniref:Peptidase n=1 Tax=Anditalea andensis TaxID=1048983 RepID=A0A074KPX6_9BACT|nr:M61 family metallopeptidase [Anditalea andensis]KEO72006.1 peptidase [Anditalea andensis]